MFLINWQMISSVRVQGQWMSMCNLSNFGNLVYIIQTNNSRWNKYLKHWDKSKVTRICEKCFLLWWSGRRHSQTWYKTHKPERKTQADCQLTTLKCLIGKKKKTQWRDKCKRKVTGYKKTTDNKKGITYDVIPNTQMAPGNHMRKGGSQGSPGANIWCSLVTWPLVEGSQACCSFLAIWSTPALLCLLGTACVLLPDGWIEKSQEPVPRRPSSL